MLIHFSHVQLFVTPWTVARQAPLSIGFSRQEDWSGLPCPFPGDLPHPGIETASLLTPALQANSWLLNHPGSPNSKYINLTNLYRGNLPWISQDWNQSTSRQVAFFLEAVGENFLPASGGCQHSLAHSPSSKTGKLHLSDNFPSATAPFWAQQKKVISSLKNPSDATGPTSPSPHLKALNVTTPAWSSLPWKTKYRLKEWG